MLFVAHSRICQSSVCDVPQGVEKISFLICSPSWGVVFVGIVDAVSKLFLVEVLYTCLINVLNRQHGSDEEAWWLFEFRESTVPIGLGLVVYEQSASQGGQAL